jgi:hypothetical protein
MLQRLFSFGFRQMFGGARRGQPVVTAFGAAMSLWWLSRRLSRKDKPVYTRELREGETVRVRMFRGRVIAGESELEA